MPLMTHVSRMALVFLRMVPQHCVMAMMRLLVYDSILRFVANLK